MPSLLAVALLLGLGGAPAPDSIPLQLRRLALDLKIDYQNRTVRGTASLRFRNRSSRPIDAVPLLLNRLMLVSKVTDQTSLRLARFTQGIEIYADDSALQVNAIRVVPAKPIRPGDSLTISVNYSGVLVGYTETGSLYIKDHVSEEFTILREDAFAFPVLGVPSWETNRKIPREDFDFVASVTVPDSFVVATGGALFEQKQRDSLVTWTYQSTGPVPFLNITIAPYHVLESAASRIYYFPADSAGAREMQQAIGQALERLERWYGPLPAKPQLSVMEIPENYGSQASLYAGIIQTADAFKSRGELRQIYHELSHLWNVPDQERPSPRWNEGLASFLQWRLAGELDGWDNWTAQVDRVSGMLLQRCAPPAPCSSIPLAGYGAAGQTDRSYQVGMLMFLALYRTMGAERFDRAYRQFFQQYRTSRADTRALVAAFTAEDPRVQTIFNDWLNTTRWYDRLARGEKIGEVIAAYTR